MQLYTVYNGPHSVAQHGIYNKANKNTYLIILSGGNYYSNINKGDMIRYSGTNSKYKMLTKNIRRILNLIIIFVIGF